MRGITGPRGDTGYFGDFVYAPGKFDDDYLCDRP